MGCNEDVVGAPGPVPEGVLRGDELHGGGEQGPSVANSREAINGAEVAGNVNGDEEEIRLAGVERPDVTGH